MKLVKRDAQKNLICAYEVFSFGVNIDQKTVTSSITKYTTNSDGLPFAEDINYVLFDGNDAEVTTISRSDRVPKRDSNGSLVFDDNGNAVFEILQNQKVPVTTVVEVKEFTKFSEAVSNMGLLDSSRHAILLSFQRRKLKDDSFNIEI